MLTNVLIVVGVVVVLLVVIIALQPAAFRVVRSATIAAPARVVFERVNDFHHWDAWSPWAKRDPGMRVTYTGAPAGEGAVYSWAGNREVGEGRMTIVESRPDELVRIKLEFLKPFTATHEAQYAFTPAGAGTAVTWAMDGRRNFLLKAIGLLMSMDKMVGGDFEKGLAQLKEASERAAAAV